jgi:transposase-like protein
MSRRPRKPGTPANIGRPTVLTEEKVEALLQWISEGKTIREFARQPGMPHYNTVYDWVKADTALAVRFARAKKAGHDALAAECLAIADEPDLIEEYAETRDANDNVITRTITRKDNCAAKKLRIWTRLQLLAKWDPRNYGEKIGIGHAEGLDPVKMTNVERVERIKAILASVKGKPVGD